MSKFWNQKTRELTPYVPGEQPKDGQKLIKLNTNECPYPPSPAVAEVLKNFDPASLRLYPNADGYGARKAFADRNGLSAEQVFAGNGSDEVLAIAFQTFFGGDSPILFPQISYSFYPVYCELYGIAFRQVPMKEDFSIPVEEFLRPCGGVVLANPNAPTTLFLGKEEIIRILKAHPDQVVIIDEAYVDFGGESMLGLIHEYDNLLVVQTLSKSRGLAGLRVGFAAGHKDLIAGLDRVKNSFNSYTLDRLAIACAEASLRDEKYFRQTVRKMMNTRERIVPKLKEMGFQVLDSKANFIFATRPGTDAASLFSYLKEQGILVRYFKQPGIDQYLRISIGTDGEMDALLSAVSQFLSK